ncbi:MAG TPA: hypothetical protein VM434_04570, partial [Beijerinckiaceae bacterium]|nr:hypothetical protein [Beijerinckiaceae bacterium]
MARAARLQERRAEQERAAAVQDQWAERRTREAAERLAGGDADAAARLDGLAADCLAEAKRLRARA